MIIFEGDKKYERGGGRHNVCCVDSDRSVGSFFGSEAYRSDSSLLCWHW